MDLRDRAVLITGGKRMGAAIAKLLGDRGADVALTYNRSRADVESAIPSVQGAGRRAIAVNADLSDPPQCERAVSQTVESFGRLDVLVNMASVYVATEFDALTVEAWQRTLDIDLRAAFLCARAAVPHMRRVGGGRIVNFSDWVARSGRPRYTGYLPYYVAKHAVVGLTEALALELAPSNILVNAIAPGPILAPEGTDEQARLAVERATPLGRWGGAEEIGKVLLAIIDSDFMTGETIRIDGGRHVY
ncbi:MAG TPA: SDR family oxidoreductase [Gemmatimonadaceae bacterium]|nr:SDR family oxidoreductase [Gemmatimonadaceae bacterium]